MRSARQSVPDFQLAKDGRLLTAVHKNSRPAVARIDRPRSEFPELIVTVPDSWKEIILAPLYDVHIGNSSHDASLFAKHVRWIAGNPHVLTWNGGDMVEQAPKLSIGGGGYEQDFSPQNQLV